MGDFDKAFESVIGFEGGYVSDPSDPGGETRYGISKRSYPGVDVRNLTLEQAKAIYHRDYWRPLRCDELPPVVGRALFDAAVNSGVRQAVLWLQRAAGVKADGDIGPATMGAVYRADPAALVARLLGHRLAFMTDRLVWARFGRGWARRIADLLKGVADQERVQ